MSYKYPPIWHQLWDICACPSPARADAHICEEKYELGIDLGSKYQEPPLMPSLMDPCSHHFTQSSRYQGAKMLKPKFMISWLRILYVPFCSQIKAPSKLKYPFYFWQIFQCQPFFAFIGALFLHKWGINCCREICFRHSKHKRFPLRYNFICISML